jgi:hypothetical protein
MADLETELAKARERVINHLHKHGLVGWDTPLAAFDVAAAIARQIVAEKNTKITELRNLVELRHSKQCENDECDLCEAAFV